MTLTNGPEPYVPDVHPAIKTLIPGYLASRRQDLAKLDAGMANSDFLALRKLGHNLKGSGGAYGLLPISQFGAEIEAAALASDLDRIRAAARALAAFLPRVVLPD